jgi:hypothetical protein
MPDEWNSKLYLAASVTADILGAFKRNFSSYLQMWTHSFLLFLDYHYYWSQATRCHIDQQNLYNVQERICLKKLSINEQISQ